MLPGRTDNAVKNRFHAQERARSRSGLDKSPSDEKSSMATYRDDSTSSSQSNVLSVDEVYPIYFAENNSAANASHINSSKTFIKNANGSITSVPALSSDLLALKTTINNGQFDIEDFSTMMAQSPRLDGAASLVPIIESFPSPRFGFSDEESDSTPLGTSPHHPHMQYPSQNPGREDFLGDIDFGAFFLPTAGDNSVTSGMVTSRMCSPEPDDDLNEWLANDATALALMNSDNDDRYHTMMNHPAAPPPSNYSLGCGIMNIPTPSFIPNICGHWGHPQQQLQLQQNQQLQQHRTLGGSSMHGGILHQQQQHYQHPSSVIASNYQFVPPLPHAYVNQQSHR
jgi:hypothetical protein